MVEELQWECGGRRTAKDVLGRKGYNAKMKDELQRGCVGSVVEGEDPLHEGDCMIQVYIQTFLTKRFRALIKNVIQYPWTPNEINFPPILNWFEKKLITVRKKSI